MDRNDVIRMIIQHNDSIDNYINGELAERLGAVNGRISLDKWFKAQELLSEQDFYKKGYAILRPCRDAGFDVKIGSNDKLCLYENGRETYINRALYTA